MISRLAHSRRRNASITTRRVALAAIATVAAVTLTPATSHADTSSTITVVGTSDVFDSDLIQNVIKPDFEAANPQYTLNYVSLGTGAAITYAEAGTASALLVHAASLENQFVAPASGPSFSDEQFGRAIFYGDYVLLGPSGDPAGVMSGTSPSHDIVTAFQKIATAGAGGTADFVSRANTSGTSVEEHAIWALTSGVPNLCTIAPGPNGGGEVPSTATGACVGGTVGTIPAPAWYHQTGLTQGPNVVAADACNFGHGNDCYTLTDRATFQFLQSEGAISNLQVVTNHNDASAVGGANLLVNSFHAYAINPAAFSANPNVHINLTGATAFLNWLTSPAGQSEIGAYQSDDPGGASFIPDAAPALTASKLPATVKSGGKLTVTGTLTNVVPGTPPLVAVPMTLTAKTASGSSVVATSNTSASGSYTLSYTPKANATYAVSSAPIAQIEIPTPTLTPQYGDLLQATSKSLGKSTVTGAPVITKISAKKGIVTISGTLSPAVVGSGAFLSIDAAHSGHALKFVAEKSLKNGAKTFTATVKLARGFTWKVSVKYVNTGQIAAGSSAARSVHVT
jgi:tungstate transport system substrate-binding protein